MRFEQAVRGLSIGAPVAFNGVDIGVVDSFALDFDSQTRRFFTNVNATLYPERLGPVYFELKVAKQTPKDLAAALSEFTSKGLRAQLRTASILTGQLYITLSDFPNLANLERRYPPRISIRSKLRFPALSVKSTISLSKKSRRIWMVWWLRSDA
jgi:paraquat-inducible protein B